MRGPLAPYFELTCAVRSGDLALFRAASDKFAAAFKADRTTNLITRLQYNVIRTGLRRINLAYSRISLQVRAGAATWQADTRLGSQTSRQSTVLVCGTCNLACLSLVPFGPSAIGLWIESRGRLLRPALASGACPSIVCN